MTDKDHNPTNIPFTDPSNPSNALFFMFKEKEKTRQNVSSFFNHFVSAEMDVSPIEQIVVQYAFDDIEEMAHFTLCRDDFVPAEMDVSPNVLFYRMYLRGQPAIEPKFVVFHNNWPRYFLDAQGPHTMKWKICFKLGERSKKPATITFGFQELGELYNPTFWIPTIKDVAFPMITTMFIHRHETCKPYIQTVIRPQNSNKTVVRHEKMPSLLPHWQKRWTIDVELEVREKTETLQVRFEDDKKWTRVHQFPRQDLCLDSLRCLGLSLQGITFVRLEQVSSCGVRSSKRHREECYDSEAPSSKKQKKM